MKSAKPFWAFLKFAEMKAWRDRVRKENAEHNSKVKTRQVSRRRLFDDEFRFVSENFDLPRAERRAIARARAKREWTGRKAVAA